TVFPTTSATLSRTALFRAANVAWSRSIRSASKRARVLRLGIAASGLRVERLQLPQGQDGLLQGPGLLPLPAEGGDQPGQSGAGVVEQVADRLGLGQQVG